MRESTCSFIEHDVVSNLKQKRTLKKFLAKLIYQYTERSSNLQFVFCSDKFLLGINKEFLDHDTFTDIITFDLSASKKDTLDAEIYISIDRVKENAQAHQTTYQQELLRVIFHGALHLCGFNDKSKKQQIEMREREDDLLIDYFAMP
jgi:probable rRNA maturation factor